MHILILIAILSMPSLASAAYTDSAQVLRHEQDQNGSARLIMRFTGNAGEPIVDRAYPITPAVSPAAAFAALRNWISLTVTELNLSRSAGTAPQVAAGTVINGLAPSATPQSAKSIWRDKVRVYRDGCTNSFTGAVATSCTTLKENIESSYQAGFLDAN